jgi:hypothetical protein
VTCVDAPVAQLIPGIRGQAEASGQGAVAQLGERLICIQEVAGSIPTSSTSLGTSARQTGQ